MLVERVEGLATEEQWMRAYDEIVQFERGLVLEAVILVKFWLQVSQDQQLERFRACEKCPLKSWKLNDEDWRNRDKWPRYVEAIEDMFAKTDYGRHTRCPTSDVTRRRTGNKPRTRRVPQRLSCLRTAWIDRQGIAEGRRPRFHVWAFP